MDLSSLLIKNETQDATAYRRTSINLPTAPNSASTTSTTPKSLSPDAEKKVVWLRLRDHPDEKDKELRVGPDDSTDSIFSSVKHYYGLSEESGLRTWLEDHTGNMIIARYQNFTDGMVVYVCISESRRHSYNLRQNGSVDGMSYGAGSVLDGGAEYGHWGQGASPHSQRASLSEYLNGQDPRGVKRFQPSEDGYDEAQHQFYGLSPQRILPDDDDSERRSGNASLASADISVDNIVEGGRRKRPKFSSDELPLFSHVTLPRPNGSVSSISPSHPPPQSYTPFNGRTMSYSHPTPVSMNFHEGYVYRNGAQQQPRYNSNGSVPTPAPTIASGISDEDVAMQLMRLGAGNANSTPVLSVPQPREENLSDGGEYGDGRSDSTEMPMHERSGLPDSHILYPRKGVANYRSLGDGRSSFETADASDVEHQAPDHEMTNTQSSYASTGEPRNGLSDVGDADYEDDLDDIPLKMRRDKVPTMSAHKYKLLGVANKPSKVINRNGAPKLKTTKPAPKADKSEHQLHTYPISPASPPDSRKPSLISSRTDTLVSAPYDRTFSQASYTSNTNGDSAFAQESEQQRPRCQRCRKSKKGCDRMRPCQRCKDAGLSADQCISEDEAGTRRGKQVALHRKRLVEQGMGMGKPKLKKKMKP